jgi:sugar phosphate isomerase/epimerase
VKLSLGSWAFSFGPHAGNPVPFDKTARRLAEAGYDGVELCGFPPHITLGRYPDRESRQQLKQFIADLGLGISGYSADLSWVNPIVEGNRDKYLRRFRRNVELCADVGSPSLRIDTVAAPGSIDDRHYEKAFARLAEIWHEAAQIAQDAGVLMVWEFEPGFVFNKPSEVLALHTRVDHSNFRVLFDTSHAYMCAVVGARQHGSREVLAGGVPEFLEKLAGRVGAIHLIDSDGTLYGDETSTHRPFGEGKIDFDDLAPRLLAVPEIDWWTIDMCFCADSWNLVDSSRAFVLDLLKRHSPARDPTS